MQSIQPTEKEKIRLLCLAAQMVLENGGETYRVEETAMRMASGLGLSDVNVVAFPTSIFVNVNGHSRIRRITHRGTNTSRLARINNVSRRVEHGELTPSEAEAELEASKCGRECHRGAEVAEVSADKADAEEDDQHDPLDHSQNGVKAFVEGNALDVKRLTRFMGNVLNEAERTDKAAEHPAEKNGANQKGSEKGEDFFP